MMGNSTVLGACWSVDPQSVNKWGGARGGGRGGGVCVTVFVFGLRDENTKEKYWHILYTEELVAYILKTF